MREAFRKKGTLYVVFDYVEKCVMDVVTANPNGTDAETVRNLTRQMASALEFCHQHHVMHRDIKPENILIDSAHTRLQLCDFGSARKVKGADVVLTDYVATRWYRAPELLISTDNYGKSVDMWGLGCVMSELATGQPLFAGSSDIDQLSIIHKALGPLTRSQRERAMELSGFQNIKFADSSKPAGLAVRVGGKMSELQLEFLKAVIAMDPEHRLTAKAALKTQWLAGSQPPAQRAPSRPTSVQRSSRRRAQSPSPNQEAPPSRSGSARRAPQVAELPPATVSSVRSTPLVGIGPGAVEAPKEVQEEVMESIAPASQALCRGARARKQEAPMPSQCEESINEEIDSSFPTPRGLRPSSVSSRPVSQQQSCLSMLQPPPMPASRPSSGSRLQSPSLSGKPPRHKTKDKQVGSICLWLLHAWPLHGRT